MTAAMNAANERANEIFRQETISVKIVGCICVICCRGVDVGRHAVSSFFCTVMVSTSLASRIGCGFFFVYSFFSCDDT